MIFDSNAQPVSVPSFIPKSVSDAATTRPNSPLSAQSKTAAIVPPVSAGNASEPFHVPYTPLLPDLSQYDLTVSEALEVFSCERRKRPSDRTLQRYCQDGRFDCYKLKTTRNGNPVHEWIINSASLLEFVHTKPVEDFSEVLAAPKVDGVATESAAFELSDPDFADAMTPPRPVGDAEQNHVWPRSSDVQPTAKTTPEEDDAASLSKVSRVELMIENAKMTARLDAQNDLIGELREDKRFMREQVVHNRQNDTLMSDMHRETLQTLKAVSVAGRHTKIEMPDTASAGERDNTFHQVRDSEQPPQNGAGDRV